MRCRAVRAAVLLLAVIQGCAVAGEVAPLPADELVATCISEDDVDSGRLCRVNVISGETVVHSYRVDTGVRVAIGPSRSTVAVTRNRQLEFVELGTLEATQTAISAWNPTWLPSGAGVVAEIDAGLGLVLLNSPGEFTLLVEPGDPRVEGLSLVRQPTVNSTGALLAFVGEIAQGDALFVLELGGTRELRMVLPPNSAGLSWPQWSPEGDSLVIATEEGPLLVTGTDGAGSAETRLMSPNPLTTTPAWSPSGTEVVLLDAVGPSLILIDLLAVSPKQAVRAITAQSWITQGVIPVGPSWN